MRIIKKTARKLVGFIKDLTAEPYEYKQPPYDKAVCLTVEDLTVRALTPDEKSNIKTQLEDKGIHYALDTFDWWEYWYVHEGDLVIDRSFRHFDFALVVKGNLTVQGLFEDDTTGNLLVLGDMHANHVDSSGTLTVMGDLNVAGLSYHHYNDCATECVGSMNSKACYISDKQAFGHQTGHDEFFRGYEAEIEGPDITKVFIADVLEVEEDWQDYYEPEETNYYISLDAKKAFEYIKAGKDIFIHVPKPDNVPEEATWRLKHYEWELGEHNTDGEKVGAWQSWKAPQGHLCCEASYEDGKLIHNKRYHANGELALEMSLNEQGKEIETYYKSTAETTEYFPTHYLNNTWQATTKLNTETETETETEIDIDIDTETEKKDYVFYDKEGQTPSIHSLVPDIAPLQKAPYSETAEQETAEQAISRFKQVVKLLKQEVTVDKAFHEFMDDYHAPYHLGDFSTEEIQENEQKLSITFPPSYKAFIRKEGLIRFGERNYHKRELSFEVSTLIETGGMSEPTDFLGLGVEVSIPIEPEDLSSSNYDELTEEEKYKTTKLYSFSCANEDLKPVFYHCFDYNTLNPETGEVSVVDYVEDDYKSMVRGDTKICQNNGFDAHISRVVDIEIQCMLDALHCQ